MTKVIIDLVFDFFRKGRGFSSLSACSVVMITMFLLFSDVVSAQPYPPAAEQPGSTAISKDAPVFKDWAVSAVIARGWMDCSQPLSGSVSAGEEQNCTGPALANGVVSLGDGGYAICNFNRPIYDGPGFDFAVFENSFDGLFLELAFVEVSSDGVNFFRFPSVSLTDTVSQTGTFGNTDPKKINNLAGKYAAGYGTPFDLSELSGVQGLNLNAITHIKIIDVVGALNSNFCTRDAAGRKINDPWPTPFAQGGFDLDAIGVINSSTLTSVSSLSTEHSFQFFPNPAHSGDIINFIGTSSGDWSLIDLTGSIILSGKNPTVETQDLAPGVYFLILSGQETKKKLVIYSSR